MTNPTNWPNPERPGVPMFPERSGRHYVGSNLLFWYSAIQKWVTAGPIQGCKAAEDFAGDEYHGPVLTPTQIAELMAGERERCANIFQSKAEGKRKILPDLQKEKNSLKAVQQDITYLEKYAEEIRNLGDAP
ncbi:MAG: hypothetical protein ABF751_09785 [Acetobacter orientalis]|uniref:hypothetical protein n=1 Tax=Acetobacter TaxID=434 RepID=UPI0039EC259A